MKKKYLKGIKEKIRKWDLIKDRDLSLNLKPKVQNNQVLIITIINKIR